MSRAIASTALEWEGVLVESGEVKVHFNAGGREHIIVTDLMVVGRPWSWSDQVEGRQGLQGEIDACMQPGQAGLTSGQSCSTSSPNVLFTPTEPQADGAYTLQSVQDNGPNGGFWYIESPATTMQLRTQVHREFRADGPAYTMAGDPLIVNACTSHFGGVFPQNIHTVNTGCQSITGFSNFIDFAWDHEGRHLTAAIAKAKTPDGNLHARWEPLVRSERSQLEFDAASEFLESHDNIAQASLATHTGIQHTFDFWRFANGAWGWYGTQVTD